MKFELPLELPNEIDEPQALIPNAETRAASGPASSQSQSPSSVFSTPFPRPVFVSRDDALAASPSLQPRVLLTKLFPRPRGDGGSSSGAASARPSGPKPTSARAPVLERREESESGSSDVEITGEQLQPRRHRSRERRSMGIRRAQWQIGRSPSGSRDRAEK